jgi:succinate dehydrogenase / fumarate reductase flavoprotein subunit
VSGKADPGAGDGALEDARARDEEKLSKLLGSDGAEDPSVLKQEMQKTMMENVGIFRTKDKLAETAEKIRELRERYRNIKLRHSGRKFNFDLMWNIELGGSLDVAECIVRGALAREECRGSHFRLDFTGRDDKRFLKHTLAYYTPDGPRLEYSDVTLGHWEPKERKY